MNTSDFVYSNTAGVREMLPELIYAFESHDDIYPAYLACMFLTCRVYLYSNAPMYPAILRPVFCLKELQAAASCFTGIFGMDVLTQPGKPWSILSR
jgi:hypothetical protein